MTMHARADRGILLIEVVIASAVILTGVVALLAGHSAFVRFSLASATEARAAYLAEEALEAAGLARDAGWTANVRPLSTSAPYYLSWNGSGWSFVSAASYVDGRFLRSVAFGEVRRDAAGKIVASGGTVDADSRMVTARVDYRNGGATTTVSVSTLVTNLNGD